MKATVPIFGIHWHKRVIPSQDELVHDPLRAKINFEPYWWDGETLPDLSATKAHRTPLVFFLLPPPPSLLGDPHTKLVWIPMWDQAMGYPSEWWRRLPKNLRVVAFSNQARISAQASGLRTLALRKYFDPEDFEAVDWRGPRILYYWNRIGLAGPEFLRRFCAALEIELLLFRPSLNPRIGPGLDYRLPDRLGATRVQVILDSDFTTREEYWRALRNANIFLAPRAFEGVGLTFLEALARGCSVFAYDGPTMNEYIQHKTNGYLLPAVAPTMGSIIRHRLSQSAPWLFPGPALPMNPQRRRITQWQDWDSIRSVSPEELGLAAREDQAIGYQSWKASAAEYADFILNW